MSKPMTRVVLSVLIALAVIVAIYTSVQALQVRAGIASVHVVNGAMTNLNHDRLTVEEQAIYQAQIESLNDNQGEGQGCESELQTSPDD